VFSVGMAPPVMAAALCRDRILGASLNEFAGSTSAAVSFSASRVKAG